MHIPDAMRVEKLESLYQEAQRELNSLRKRLGHKIAVCRHCGKGFWIGKATGRRSRSQYCGDTCRKAAWMKRRDDVE